MNSFSKIVVNPLAKSGSPLVKTPTPEIGDCQKKGTWDDSAQVDECNACIDKNKDYPGYNYFYCNGTCTSEYEPGGGGCALNSLVAFDNDQCKNPCYQIKAPSSAVKNKKFCTKDSDCPSGNTCVFKDINADDERDIEQKSGRCEADLKEDYEQKQSNFKSDEMKNAIIIGGIISLILILIIIFLSIYKNKKNNKK